jgi:23S rRNA (pseudouridine1915-N3)-methyltransferase
VILLVAVGRVRGVLEAAVAEYESRLPHYWKFSVVEVDAGTGRGGPVDAERVMAAEAERILARVPDGGELWVVTREGRSLDSATFARTLGERQLHAAPPLVLALGGAFGFDPEVVARSTRRLSLSSMTLPHEMARLLLVEQLYRAGTILRNEPYHKGTR